MATSGTTTFSVTGLDIIKQALQDVGKLRAGQTPDSDDQTDCLRVLNMIIKALTVEGFQLWTYQTLSFPTVVGQSSYSIGPFAANVTNSRPIRVMQAWARDTATPPNDRPMIVIGRYDYNLLTPKAVEGVPVNVYYDPQLNTGRVYLWPTPVDTSLTIYLLIQRQIEDMAIVGNDFDFPQEYYQPLRYLLASDIGPMYGCPERTQMRLDQKAEFYRNKMADFQTAEEPSVSFMPNFQVGAARHG